MATRFNMLVTAWSTNLVSDAGETRRYEDLMEARWRGKIGIEASDHSVFLAKFARYDQLWQELIIRRR